MGGVIRGARRVPADAVAAYREADVILREAREEARRILARALLEADACRKEAEQGGRAEGIAAVAGAVAAARAALAGAADLRQEEIVELAVAVAGRVVGDCHEVDPELAARRAAETIRRSFHGPVRLRAAPDLAAAVGRVVGSHGQGPERPVGIEEDATLAPGVCILEGDCGEVRLDDREILHRIRDRLLAGLRSSEREGR